MKLLALLPLLLLAACTPQGFTPLFNGHDLSGWQGLVESPPVRARMSREDLAKAQAIADQRMRDHWHVESHTLVFDGRGDNICTIKPYKDFELRLEWKIEKAGDSGVYLRGSPQVQIWDSPLGSGGLYNNEHHPSNPLLVADNPPGQWNRFDITMEGDTVTVYLNNKLVVDHTVMENYWERDKPIYPIGPIELQNHGSSLHFRNIYIRPITH